MVKKKPGFEEAFANAGVKPPNAATRAQKKNYAEALSRQIARVFADQLRVRYKGILPDAEGKGQESRARTSKGFKKLDVNYSTIDLGLALGISIKTINYADAASKRFTKNYSRNENELRAEATDYHKRQPWAVLIAIIFLPMSSCDDGNSAAKGEQGASSFGSAARFFRNIAGRQRTDGPLDQFEKVFIALHDDQQRVVFFDVEKNPPKARRPRTDETLTFEKLIDAIEATYDERNSPPFKWADDDTPVTEPLDLPDEPED
ncbi:MAG TPA: hypothetical protein VF432_13175 [Thermoanaerobaculia bacterium]